MSHKMETKLNKTHRMAPVSLTKFGNTASELYMFNAEQLLLKGISANKTDYLSSHKNSITY